MNKRSFALLTIFAALMLALLGYPAIAGHNATSDEQRMAHIATDPNPGTTNSDIAFWGNIMALGTYDGFRLFNISNPSSPVELVDFPCNGSQGDVTLHKAGDRLLLFRSIDNPQDRPECEGSANSSTEETSTNYFEGIRILDVTNPRKPKFIKGVYTDCGSHTHTTIRDTKNNRAIIYVSSYPLGTPTMDPDGAEQTHAGCRPATAHKKIGIIVVPNSNPSRARLHHYEEIDAPPTEGLLGEDAPVDGVIGCHDITAYYPAVKVAAAACITEGQLWDISNPLQPCTMDPNCSTHVRNGSVEIWHSSAFTWDGKIVLFGDEHTGAVTGPGCFGPGDPSGNVWFYQKVKPGTPTAPLLGRYHTPRAQPSLDVCSMHNFNVIPVEGSRSYIGVSAVYSAGTTVFNFTQAKTTTPTALEGSAVPIIAKEIAWWDTTSAETNNDVWSAYWYNNAIHANDINRGLDSFRLLKVGGGVFTALKFPFHNPQTQEKLLRATSGDDDGDDD